MSKRRATTQLTRDDLDRDDSPEREEPEFSGSGIASADVLSKRKIITARRSLTSPSSSSLAKPSPFANINLTASASGGSSNSIIMSGSSSSFTGLSSATSSSAPAAASVPLFGSTLNKYQPAKPSPLARPDPVVTNGNSDKKRERADVFYEKLRSLNHSFQQHMTSHLQKDPEANYSQNCQEYINYMEKLGKDYPILSVTDSVDEQAAAPEEKPVTTSLTSQSSSTKNELGSNQSVSLASKSSLNPAASPFVPPAPVSSMFPPLTTSTSGFQAPTFGSGFLTPAAPGPSSSLIGGASTVKEEVGDDDDYVPPKNEDINTEEEDSVYSKRIKLYYLKDKKYEVMGKGMLHVKSLNGSKHQLLVRGENAIGSIWLNVLLVDGIPMKLVGGKDVQIVCMTKSPANPKDPSLTSVTYLLRCATTTDASDLLDNLTKYAGTGDEKSD